MSLLYFDAKFIPADESILKASDSAFTGIGVFDSMLAEKGEPIYADDHYERLIHDAKTVIGILPPITFAKFTDVARYLLDKNNLKNGYARVRTTITGGPVSAPLQQAKSPTLFMSVGKAKNPEDFSPLQCMIVHDFPRIAGCALENCKRLDYSRSYAARRQAEHNGADEAILINTAGRIACGATSNLFIAEGNMLITPPLSEGILDGITRRKIIEKGNVREELISEERLQKADAVFLTNSFFGLRKVEKII
jgi:branched-chain amino acid aminotransferase